MQADAELRLSWRARWLVAIREFADMREQRATWMSRDSDNPHFTFVEYICSYFDGLNLDGDGYATALSEGLLATEEVEAVANLHKLLSAYSSPGDDDYDHAAILDDPAWRAVAEAAQQAAQRLERLLTDPNERHSLFQSSIQALRVSSTLGSA